MSGTGVNAAATLTLEINTSNVDPKLDALEQRLNRLGDTKVDAGAGSMKKLYNEVGDTTQQVHQLEKALTEAKAQVAALGSKLSMSNIGGSTALSGISKKFAVDANEIGAKFTQVTDSLAKGMKDLAGKGVDLGSLIKGEKLETQKAKIQDSIGGLKAYIAKLEEVKRVSATVGNDDLMRQAFGSNIVEMVGQLDQLKGRLGNLQSNEALGKQLKDGTKLWKQELAERALLAKAAEQQMHVDSLFNQAQKSVDTSGRNASNNANQVAYMARMAELEKAQTEELAKQKALRNNENMANQVGYMARMAELERIQTEELAQQKRLRNNENGANQVAYLARMAELEKAQTTELAEQKRLRSNENMANQVAYLARMDALEQQITTQIAEQNRLRNNENMAKQVAYLAQQAELEREVTREKIKQNALDAKSVSYLASTPRQQAAQNLRAGVAISRGYDTSAYAPEAVAAAQSTGSVKALTEAYEKLRTTQAGAVTAGSQHAKHMWEMHSAARGLAGGLNALWLTYGDLVPLMAGAALSGGFIAATKAGSEFAFQLTFVKALGGSTSKEISQIGDAALNMAKSSMYGPVELANGLRILSQAGLNAADSLTALPSAMQLATVGEMNMEQAAVTLTGVMNAFSLNISDMSHIGDVFAKAAALSQTSVQGMTEAMKTASVVGEQYGASMEDTATALTLLAKVNISGTAAGTAFRNMVKEIYAPTSGAAAVIKQLGLETKDAAGNLKSFPDIIYQLKTSLAGYDKASQVNILQALFGERGAKEAIAMLAKTREQWEELKGSIQNSDGFMAGVTAELETSTKGMFSQAFNTLQSSMIESFEKAEGPVRKLAVALRDLADSDAFKQGMTTIVESVAKLATVLVDIAPALLRFAEAWAVWKGVGLIVGGITAASSAIAGLGTTMAIVSAEAAVIGGGLAAVSAGLTAAAGSAGVAAGAMGGGMLLRSLTLLTNPITLVVAGVAALAWGLNEYVLKMPGTVDAAETFVAALDRENKKLIESIELLEKKNRLQLSGKSVDTNKAEAELASIVENRDKAIERKNDPNASIFERMRAEREYSALVKSEMKARGKLTELENNQMRLDSANLVSVLQTAAEGVAKVKADATSAKKTVDTSGVEAMIKAYSGKQLKGADVRAVNDELNRRLSAANQSLLGSGTGKWTPPDPNANKGAADAKTARTIFNKDLASDAKKEAIRLSEEQLKIDQRIASQEISSVAAIVLKDEATRKSLAAEMDQLKVMEARAAKDKDAVEIESVKNAIAEKQLQINKQVIESELHAISAKTALRNAIEDTQQAGRHYSEDLQFERDMLGKTTEEVAKLRIEKQRLRDLDGLQVKVARGQIEPGAAEAERNRINANAELADSDAKYQNSFQGGWDKAFDSYVKSASNAASLASDAFKSATDLMEGTIVAFTTTGKFAFKDFVKSALTSLAQLAARQAAMGLAKLAFSAIASYVGSSNVGAGTPVANNTSTYSTPVSTSSGIEMRKLNANGGVYQSPSLHQYANQVHDTPKLFQFAKGGVFAEAGPEAIMPLKRDGNGRLGVIAAGGGGGHGDINVSVSVTVMPDGSSKQETKSDGAGANAKQLGEMIANTCRGVLVQEMRSGGLLSGVKR